MSQSIRHVFTLFAFFLAGCAQPVLVESIRAKVVDDSSGEPLEGVHVVFKATAYEGTFTGHGGRKVNLLVAEGVTNATGIIELPAQKIDPEPFWFNTHYDYPWIYFFKSGYLPAIEKNPWNGLASLETVQRWQYNGKTVRLKKPNDFNEYIEKISFLGNEIEGIYR